MEIRLEYSTFKSTIMAPCYGFSIVNVDTTHSNSLFVLIITEQFRN